MKTIETSSSSMQIAKNRTRSITSLLFTFAVVLSLSQTAFAQSISTSAQLKQACENSPGNVVNITQPTKIEFGPALPTPENIATGCTLQIGPNAASR